MNKQQLEHFNRKKSKHDREVRKMLRDGSGKAALSRAGLLVPERPDYEKPRPRIALLVPSYHGLQPLTLEAIGHMREYSKPWVETFSPPRSQSSVVHWVRNGMLADVIASGEPFDYVLFIDDDIVPRPDALVRLLSHRKDITAALCTRRVDPPIPCMMWLDKNYEFAPILKWSTPDPLLKVDAAGTGMMLISREAIEAVGEFYLRCGYERQVFGRTFNRALENAFAGIVTKGQLENVAMKEFAYLASDEFEKQLELMEEQRRETFRRTGNAQWFQFLPKLNDRGEYGEDISFCFKARFCDIWTHCDVSVTPGHIGDYVYSIDDFFPYQARMAGIPEIVEKMDEREAQEEPQILVTE